MTDEFIERFSVDNNGNLYFDNYWLYINKYDNIDFFKVNNKCISKVSTDIKNKEEILQIKMIESEIEELKNKFNDVDNAYDFNEEDVLHFKKYIYNPELKFVKEKHQSKEEQIKYQLNHDDINDDDEDDEYNNQNCEPYIQIHGDFNLNNNNFDDISNYEVYAIINDNLASYTELVYDNPLYRISIIVKNNKSQLQLNIIGTKTITYDIEKIEKIEDIEDKENIEDIKPFNLTINNIQYQMI
jgi:hypothetical protein